MRISLITIFLSFLRLGLTAFGGPAMVAQPPTAPAAWQGPQARRALSSVVISVVGAIILLAVYRRPKKRPS